MDLARYAELFLTESREHLAVMNRHLLVLERSPGARESLDATFRAVHTVKGMSATMGYDAVTALAHEMETVLDALRAGRLAVTASRIAACLDVADALEGMVEGAVRGDDLASVGEPLVQRLRVLATDGEDAAAAPAVPAATPAAPSGSPAAAAPPCGCVTISAAAGTFPRRTTAEAAPESSRTAPRTDRRHGAPRCGTCRRVRSRRRAADPAASAPAWPVRSRPAACAAAQRPDAAP